MRTEYGDSVAYTFIHFPLSGHQHAYPAARAAECAESQGRFDAFVGAVFEGQEKLGQPWSTYAQEARVPDSLAFSTCVRDTSRVDRIDRGRAVGALLKVRGTPTVIVNGWRFPTTPSDSLMRRVVGELLSGRRPFQ